MNWNNLKKNNCPKCNAKSTVNYAFNYDPKTDILSCRKCDFKITQQRYKEILSDMVAKKIDEQTYDGGN
jgi:transcription elongation factor Elf1